MQKDKKYCVLGVLGLPIQAYQIPQIFYIGLFVFRAVGRSICLHHMTGWPPVAISLKVSKGGELWVIWGYWIGVYQRERITN